ncbi:hypothetical protein CRYUN_Cryun07bG0085500 [Craigia yunnanensis]
METAKVPACLSMKMYRRKKYQRLKRMVSTSHEDNENETISMLEEYRRRGMMKSKVMVPKVSPMIANLPVEPLRKWRDAYVEMMLCFAGHVAQLNNGNV